jgi:hypothetical protein
MLPDAEEKICAYELCQRPIDVHEYVQVADKYYHIDCLHKLGEQVRKLADVRLRGW